jgi:hypothetical protein
LVFGVPCVREEVRIVSSDSEMVKDVCDDGQTVPANSDEQDEPAQAEAG